MSADSPMMKFVRWRVRDLAACFFACKIPRVDEERNCSTSTDTMPRKTMAFDPIGEPRRRQNDGQKLRKKESNQVMKASFESSKQSTNSKISEDGSSFLKEEEYLVFCFKDDGTIHMINDKRPSSEASIGSNTITHKCNESADESEDKEIISANESGTSLSNEQQKSIVNGQAEGEGNNDAEAFSIADEEIKEINHNESQEGKTLAAEGEGSNDVEVVSLYDEIKEVKYTESQEGETLSSMLSAVEESSDSNDQSDASSSSFAFPVMRWEWMGSPVHMPKSEDVGLRAQKARGACLQCCRF